MSRNTETYDIEDHELERFKREIKKEAYSLFDNYNFWNEINISKEEFLVLRGISNHEVIILQQVDKANSVVLVNKVDYAKKMKEL